MWKLKGRARAKRHGLARQASYQKHFKRCCTAATQADLLCSGLSSSKNRQVRKSYTTNTMSFFLRIQKKKIQQLSLLGYGNTTCFCVFFAFFPCIFFFFFLKVTWICTRYGVEKNAVQKRNSDERKIRVETHCK